eukprot:CAMPEP_0202691408 /NCGR_PEP_ID=MMETSP1385-20130828/6128_1 /ASSEMBLY_ACC=CAM_ASM_000861 /TAXON_ID=933848 /ORGANISM="Elphidium margaritaceum" /LENGTH=505 /DNA_ID=CAMNT_0049346809 /DNA_START=58 /DNA_END=1575 /DNA_ORIENTATION=-
MSSTLTATNTASINQPSTQFDELKQIVTTTLDKQGILAKAQAQLRKHVFEVLCDRSHTPSSAANLKPASSSCDASPKIDDNDMNDKLAMALIHDFLSFHGLHFTLSLMNTESQKKLDCIQGITRNEIASRLGLAAQKPNPRQSLLHELVAKLFDADIFRPKHSTLSTDIRLKPRESATLSQEYTAGAILNNTPPPPPTQQPEQKQAFLSKEAVSKHEQGSEHSNDNDDDAGDVDNEAQNENEDEIATETSYKDDLFSLNEILSVTSLNDAVEAIDNAETPSEEDDNGDEAETETVTEIMEEEEEEEEEDASEEVMEQETEMQLQQLERIEHMSKHMQLTPLTAEYSSAQKQYKESVSRSPSVTEYDDDDEFGSDEIDEAVDDEAKMKTNIVSASGDDDKRKEAKDAVQSVHSAQSDINIDDYIDDDDDDADDTDDDDDNVEDIIEEEEEFEEDIEIEIETESLPMSNPYSIIKNHTLVTDGENRKLEDVADLMIHVKNEEIEFQS